MAFFAVPKDRTNSGVVAKNASRSPIISRQKPWADRSFSEHDNLAPVSSITASTDPLIRLETRARKAATSGPVPASTLLYVAKYGLCDRDRSTFIARSRVEVTGT